MGMEIRGQLKSRSSGLPGKPFHPLSQLSIILKEIFQDPLFIQFVGWSQGNSPVKTFELFTFRSEEILDFMAGTLGLWPCMGLANNLLSVKCLVKWLFLAHLVDEETLLRRIRVNQLYSNNLPAVVKERSSVGKISIASGFSLTGLWFHHFFLPNLSFHVFQ